MSRSIQILVHSNDEPLATFARAVADGVHAPLRSSDEGFSVSLPHAYVMIDDDDGSDLPSVPSPLEHDKLIQLDQVTSIDALTSSADVVFQGLKAQQRYGLVMVFDSQREMARFTPPAAL